MSYDYENLLYRFENNESGTYIIVENDFEPDELNDLDAQEEPDESDELDEPWHEDNEDDYFLWLLIGGGILAIILVCASNSIRGRKYKTRHARSRY